MQPQTNTHYLYCDKNYLRKWFSFHYTEKLMRFIATISLVVLLELALTILHISFLSSRKEVYLLCSNYVDKRASSNVLPLSHYKTKTKFSSKNKLQISPKILKTCFLIPSLGLSEGNKPFYPYTAVSNLSL